MFSSYLNQHQVTTRSFSRYGVETGTTRGALKLDWRHTEVVSGENMMFSTLVFSLNNMQYVGLENGEEGFCKITCI